MIEHTAWVGPRFADSGLHGQRLGILGYSAWTENDYANYTCESVLNVISGAWSNVQFFNAIPRYFDWDRADFYNRTLFFEFVPCAIGGKDARYNMATPDQVDAGRARVLRLVREHRIDKLFVFSAKAWSALAGLSEFAAEKRMRLGNTRFRYVRSEIDNQPITVIGMRHPQYAPMLQMREAVAEAMALPFGVAELLA